jgi:GNAT superfamily N-acetyltransferase
MNQDKSAIALPVNYKIENTSEADLEFIYRMFEEAMLFHKRNNYPVWKGYDKSILQREIKEKLQYKILIGDKISLVFSAIYSDKYLWHEKEKDDAIYLHRIVVNPEFRGLKLFTHVFHWAINDAKKRGRKYLRLDTWGDNPKMINYYQMFGFRFVENYLTPDDHELPIPHRNLFLALLEYEIPEV